jgi:hypothetical protein
LTRRNEQENVRHKNFIKKKPNGKHDEKRIKPYVEENLVTETQAVEYFFDNGEPQELLTRTIHIIYPLVLKKLYPDVVELRADRK